MEAEGLTPIVNVSDIAATVGWFEKWGWKKLWDWGTPPTLGVVGSGQEASIFLCQGPHGGRGRGVDEMYKHCVAAGLEVTFPPPDMLWNLRGEMHLRHPDSHVFRVCGGLEPNN